MPSTSPFFNHTYPGQSTEQNLVDDLVIEQIKMFGLDVLYMPRYMLNLDRLLHESSKSAFEFAMPIPMYLKTFSGYNNGLEMLTKFGVRASDEMTLIMSRSEFNTHYAPFIKSYYNKKAGRPEDATLEHLEGETSRPKEGDLIYFPFDDGIFEIKYVMFDQPFFQLGKGYVYEIMCEKFEYSGETLETGYDQIDDVQVSPDYYRLEFITAQGGTGAFEFNETVTIYDFTEVDFLANEEREGLTNEERVDLVVDEVFRLYNDPGYLEHVPQVTARVMDWNVPEGVLTVTDLSNLDPDQIDRDTLLVDINKFDTVIIKGNTSGATWSSVKARMMDMAGADNNVIQDEFDDIKIIDDPFDQNPFGFV